MRSRRARRQQLVDVDVDRVARRGEQDHVAALARRQCHHAPGERRFQALETAAIAPAAREHVGRKHATLAEVRLRVAMERQRVEHAGATLRIVAIDQDQVEVAVRRLQVVAAVVDGDAQARALRRQLEVLPRARDDIGIDLHDRVRRARPVPVKEARDRPGTETDRQHGARPAASGVQQQREDHVARVLELQGVGRAMRIAPWIHREPKCR